nr:truncated ORF1 [Porcine circovirus]
MPSKKSGRSGPQPHKRWVFTLNNPSEDERKKIRELPISLFDYFIVGEGQFVTLSPPCPEFPYEINY